MFTSILLWKIKSVKYITIHFKVAIYILCMDMRQRVSSFVFICFLNITFVTTIPLKKSTYSFQHIKGNMPVYNIPVMYCVLMYFCIALALFCVVLYFTKKNKNKNTESTWLIIIKTVLVKKYIFQSYLEKKNT